jgi:hypothetical protein
MKNFIYSVLDDNGNEIKPVWKVGTAAEHFVYCVSDLLEKLEKTDNNEFAGYINFINKEFISINNSNELSGLFLKDLDEHHNLLTDQIDRLNH